MSNQMSRQQATEELALKLGWGKKQRPQGDVWYNKEGQNVGSSLPFAPWDNIADAEKLLTKLVLEYWLVSIEYWLNYLVGRRGMVASCRLTKGLSTSVDYRHHEGIGSELAEAITLAVCKAYGIEIEEVGDVLP